MSAKKEHTKVQPPVEKSAFNLGEIAAGFLGGVKDALPDITRLGAGIALRALAGNPVCVEFVAKTMCADEEVEWEPLPGAEKRVWKLRAKAALQGVDKFAAAMADAAPRRARTSTDD